MYLGIVLDGYINGIIEYILESGRSDGDSENIVIVYLRVNEDVKIEDVEKALLMEEED